MNYPSHISTHYFRSSPGFNLWFKLPKCNKLQQFWPPGKSTARVSVLDHAAAFAAGIPGWSGWEESLPVGVIILHEQRRWPKVGSGTLVGVNLLVTWLWVKGPCTLGCSHPMHDQHRYFCWDVHLSINLGLFVMVHSQSWTLFVFPSWGRGSEDIPW